MRASVAAFVLASALLAASSARAAGMPEGSDARFAEGRKWFQDSGNPDLSGAERNAARVKAWKCLWPLKEALDRAEEEEPSSVEELDRKYGEVRMMVHWIKKESPVGLLESSGVGPAKGVGAGVPPATPAAPAPTAPEPATPAPAPATPAPAAARPPSPAAPTVASLFAIAEAYEKKHPKDAPGIQTRYLDVVAHLTDPSDPLVRKALEKSGEMESRLKDAYKLLRNEDPDALKGVDDQRLRGMAITVARDVASQDAAVRERAAKTLGTLAHGEGVYPMRKRLEKKTDAGPADAMVEALVRIGGGKAAEALADFKADERHAARCLDGLVRLSKRNPVDRRLAALALSAYMGAREEAHFDVMLATLRGLGREGLLGLQECCRRNTTPHRLIAVFDALSVSKDPAVVRIFARYFQEGRGPDDARIREAAMAAVRRMHAGVGDAILPHLFVGVRNGFTRYYTTGILQELTGQKFSVKQWAQWSAWWRKTHPDWKEGDEGGEDDAK